MVDLAQAGPSSVRGARLRLSAALWRHPWVKALALLSPPVLAFVLVYIGALVVLFVSAFWQVNSFTGQIELIWNLGNFRSLIHDPVYRRIALRTIGIAA